MLSEPTSLTITRIRAVRLLIDVVGSLKLLIIE
jgi:hypothetical protein